MSDQDEGEREFSIQVAIDGDVGTLVWADQVSLDTLTQGVSLASDDAILGHGLRRVEARVMADDEIAAAALEQCGFRREGRLRQAVQRGESLVDVLVYGRLATDQVYGSGGSSAVMDSVLPTKRVIAQVLVRDPRGRVLLADGGEEAGCDLPGAVVEPGQSPSDAAASVLQRRIGIDGWPGDPIVVDWAPPQLGWRDTLVFVHGALTVTEEAPAAEHAPDGPDLVWVHPDELTDRVEEYSARRIRLALDAGVRALFTQDGRLPRR